MHSSLLSWLLFQIILNKKLDKNVSVVISVYWGKIRLALLISIIISSQQIPSNVQENA